jgi:hypothetical protein
MATAKLDAMLDIASDASRLPDMEGPEDHDRQHQLPGAVSLPPARHQPQRGLYARMPTTPWHQSPTRQKLRRPATRPNSPRCDPRRPPRLRRGHHRTLDPTRRQQLDTLRRHQHQSHPTSRPRPPWSLFLLCPRGYSSARTTLCNHSRTSNGQSNSHLRQSVLDKRRRLAHAIHSASATDGWPGRHPKGSSS